MEEASGGACHDVQKRLKPGQQIKVQELPTATLIVVALANGKVRSITFYGNGCLQLFIAAQTQQAINP
jgi:hypothetical protein